MSARIKISDQLTVGAQPSEEDLEGLVDEGFKSVVNLRAAGEADQPLSPDAEGEKATSLGLVYCHIPVSMMSLSPDLVDRIREQFAQLPAPIYVHCQKGKRAGTMAVIHSACQQGRTGEQTLQVATEAGFPCDQQALADFVTKYVDQRRQA